MRQALALALAAGLAAGCGSESPPPVFDPDAAVPEGELWLGAAAADGTGFIEIADGEDVVLVSGAQGGFHVWINVRVKGVFGTLQMFREARRVSDGELVLAATRQILRVPEEAATDWWESPDGAATFMCPAPIGLQIFDVPIEITVTLTDREGTELAEGSLIVVPRCPSGSQAEFCASICAG